MTYVDSALITEVRGYRVALDRGYDPDTHMWAKLLDGGTVRLGLDPLGVEMNGTLAQLSIVSAGVELVRGRPFGQLEAAKFVGPLLSPMSGTVVVVNDAVVHDPALVERDPLDAGWLVELAPSRAADEMNMLLSSPAEIVGWFSGKVDEYRLKGVIAE